MAKKREDPALEESEDVVDPRGLGHGSLAFEPDSGDEGNASDPDNQGEDAGDEDEDKKSADLMAQIEKMRDEIRSLRESRPNTPDPAPKKEEPEPEPDWETLLYEKPKEAVALIEKRIRSAVEKELTTKYERDQGAKLFWDHFYKENPDLGEDRDLVEVLMQSNLKTLGGMSAADASKKLAELTRERIMRYTGTKDDPNKDRGKGKKAHAEGGGGKAPKRPAPAKEEVTTLSEIIRARRAQRMNSARKGTAA